MNRKEFLKDSFVTKKSFMLVGGVFLLLSITEVSFCQQEQINEKAKVLHKVACEWIEIANEQYKRGHYTFAEQSCMRVLEYKELLSEKETKELNALLEKAHIASLKRKLALEKLTAANELLSQGQLFKADEQFEKIKDNMYLTNAERQGVLKALSEITDCLNNIENQINELSKKSIMYYRAGQPDKAKETIVQMENIIAGIGEVSQDVNDVNEETNLEVTSAAEPNAAKEQIPYYGTGDKVVSVIKVQPSELNGQELVSARGDDVVNIAEPGSVEDRKAKLLAGRTTAVVNDAISKAESYIEIGDPDSAEKIVSEAEMVVDENRFYLGDKLYKPLVERLNKLKDIISEKKLQNVNN